MELTKGNASNTNSEREALLTPSTFNADQERRELQNLVASSAPSSVESCNEVVATAIPISPDDVFQQNDIPMVTATAVTDAHSGVHPTNQSTSSNTKDSKEELIVSPILPPQQSNNPNYAPTASPIRNYSTPTAEQHTTASLLRQAHHRGMVEAEIERTQDTFAKTALENIRNETTAALHIAKLNAEKSKRVDEGLTVDGGIHEQYNCNSNTTSVCTDNAEEVHARPFGTTTKDGKRGYEVNEYEVAEYDTAEYDTSEYKSLYD
jgi:hypothetical protein